MTNEQVFTAIRAATQSVFSTMLSLTVTPGETLLQSNPPPLDGALALLGFTGEWVGTGMLFCQKDTACRLSSIMTMTEIAEINDEVLDGVGELANMVLGNVKDHLEPVAGPLAMSIPTVIFGRNFQARPTGHRDWLIAPFKIGEQSFEIRICLAPKNSKGKTA